MSESADAKLPPKSKPRRSTCRACSRGRPSSPQEQSNGLAHVKAALASQEKPPHTAGSLQHPAGSIRISPKLAHGAHVYGCPCADVATRCRSERSGRGKAQSASRGCRGHSRHIVGHCRGGCCTRAAQAESENQYWVEDRVHSSAAQRAEQRGQRVAEPAVDALHHEKECDGRRPE
eukprot:scaffold302346_cov32-Tisochrysis_lutea.AAC.2